MQIGDALHGNLGWFDFLATFLINIGDIMTTFLTAVSAILVGFLGAGVGSRLGHAINDRAPRSIVDILRYPLGALAIGVLGLMIGSAINWMYDYGNENPAIAMATGAIMMVMVGGSITGRLMRPVRQRVPGIFGSLLGFFTVIAGIIGGIFAGIGLGKLAVVIVDAIGGGNGTVWAAALVGAILGTALAWATRRLDSLPSGLIAYYLSRSLFNAIRSVEPLVMAIVFVVWVGVGPFAGSLALALHTTAALAKLYSEQVESIMTGPMEAITATGATRLQNIIYAVVPQIVPPYIAFTLYRWDINVRMSTIIGFAGGGGIGFLLQQNINLLQYRDASVQMLAIAIVVSSLDFLSARIRERIV
ncbi:ABC transporter permease subunit [bacterium]|nr:ABC transporter permease subunit [bacterium]